MPVLISRPSTTSVTHGHCLVGSARMRDPNPGTRVKGRVLYVPQPPGVALLPPSLAAHACGTSAAHARGVSVSLPVCDALAIFDKETCHDPDPYPHRYPNPSPHPHHSPLTLTLTRCFDYGLTEGRNWDFPFGENTTRLQC